MCECCRKWLVGYILLSSACHYAYEMTLLVVYIPMVLQRRHASRTDTGDIDLCSSGLHSYTVSRKPLEHVFQSICAFGNVQMMRKRQRESV
ncbi:hypothetical protein CC86DRAFT_62216 [Ophiobolus disseminans]|uniref:Uncharacterized protein n=1 Tax=Ophiobolus disseminans TaxID=1469910 RepID=A0A6A6ZS94_9PLEO|nr:hypothetical protein CC86DRAFT_62216 [Ophiobolus disseminans]